ncbi:TetR family transcriptional regulator [Glycomyces fuscus]|nr:TetR family transcriptional regulator [Glycomyces fuscus]
MAKRGEILDAALEVIGRDGYSRATVREIADAVGLSQNGLLHHFGSKERLFVEVLRHRDELDRLAYGEGAGQRPDIAESLVRLVRHNARVPGLVQLYSRFSAEAAEEGHPAHGFFQERYATARGIIAEAIRSLQEEGRLPPGHDADRLAVLGVALMDGLQAQWAYDSGVDMAGHLAHFLDLVGLRSAARNPAGEDPDAGDPADEDPPAGG